MVLASLASGAHTLGVDVAGNRVTETAPSGAISYSYNAEGRLSSAVFGNGSSLTRRFDAEGRCIQETGTTPGGASTTKRWYYDGSARALTVVVIDGPSGINESLTKIDLYSADTSAPMMQLVVSAGSVTQFGYAVVDDLGNTSAILDPAGGLVQHYRYMSEFGLVTAHASNSASSTSFVALPFPNDVLWKSHRRMGLCAQIPKPLYELASRVWDAETSSHLQTQRVELWRGAPRYPDCRWRQRRRAIQSPEPDGGSLSRVQAADAERWQRELSRWPHRRPFGWRLWAAGEATRSWRHHWRRR